MHLVLSLLISDLSFSIVPDFVRLNDKDSFPNEEVRGIFPFTNQGEGKKI